MPARNYWYGKKTWSARDAADFERRLARSRGQKAQYMKLQASQLADTGKASVAPAAIELANRYLLEEPDGIFEVEAHVTIAKAKASLADVAGALQAYRTAVKVEKRKRNPHFCSYLDYAWYAVEQGASDSYDDVLKALRLTEEEDLVFPLTQYKYFGSLALISSAAKDRANARRMARNALEAAKRAAPFSRHKGVGVVRSIDPAMRKKIERLAT